MMRYVPAANENGDGRLIGEGGSGTGDMNTNPSPKSVDQNVQALSTVCHVVEVKAPFALVHASPTALAQIIGQLGLTVSPSKKGGDYYAVRVEATPAATRTALSVVPAAPMPAPAPKAQSGSIQMNIGGGTYNVVETATKRSQDVRRWEVSKPGQDGEKPYVVTFQSADGSRTACSCKGGIFHKHCKHMDAISAAFGKRAQQNVA